MKKIAVLLNGGIINDSRVIKTINTLSEFHYVDLFYVNGTDKDKVLFNSNVRLFVCSQPFGIKNKVIRHSFFYKEFDFFANEVLKQNIKYDYVWSNDLPTLNPGVIVKKHLNCKLIYDSHEIYVETLNQFFPDNAVLYKRILYKIILFIMTFIGNVSEKKMIKYVDDFITVNTSLKKYFEKKFERQNIHVVMNCPRYKQIKEQFNWRTEFKLTEQDVICIFQGVLNKGRALGELIRAMQNVPENIKLIILGNGTLKQELKQMVENLDISNKVFFKDAVPSSELLKYTNGADIGINLQSSINISKHLASANKLFEYMHVGIPIIASNVPENKIVNDKYHVGCLVENIPDDIAKGIEKMANADRTFYKENCKKAALEYNWGNQEKVILSIVK